MKTTHWASGIAVAGLLAFAGCGKSEQPSAQRISASMDLQKFAQAFPAPTPEQQKNVAKASQGVRYRMYPDALAALDQLSGDASLTDAQKKAVSDLIEGVKQALTNTSAAPAQ